MTGLMVEYEEALLFWKTLALAKKSQKPPKTAEGQIDPVKAQNVFFVIPK